MPRVIGYLSLLAAFFVVASCSSSNSSGSSSSAASSAVSTTPQSSAAPPESSPPTPKTFTSAAYGYTVTVPAGWTSRQAYAKWDGESGLNGDSAYVDLLGQPGETRGVWVAAAPRKGDLAAYTTFLIAWNFHVHGDTCPQRPNMREPVMIGGQPGILLAYNCGILVNNAATIHDGVGYFFAFVDHDLAAATDPTDHATFLKILKSVQFPA